MLLNYDEVQEAIRTGEIEIDPFEIKNLGPNSYDLTIHENVNLLNMNPLNGKFVEGVHRNYSLTDKISVPTVFPVKLPYLLPSGGIIRCATNEKVKVASQTYGIIHSRSNLSRFPLRMSFGPLVDTGYSGNLSFVISNDFHIPIMIEPNMRVLQILFYKCNPMSVKYFDRKNSKNRNQNSGVPGFNVDREYKNAEKNN